jgi:ATP-dependent Clp protease ATP-binding subunit ClpC
MQIMRGSFRPEFINRIDEIIVFRGLTREQLAEITKLLPEHVRSRLRAQHIEVEFSDAAVEHLAEVGFDPEFGARPLRRAIQRELENELSRMVLSSELAPDDRVRVDASDGQLTFQVEKGAAQEAEEVDEEPRRSASDVTGEHALAPRA